MHGKQRGGFGNGNNAPQGNPPGNDPGDIGPTETDDHIKGTDNVDIIDGLGGDDLVIGFAGDDVIIGGAGEDDLNGSADNDVLIGGTVTDNDATAGFTPLVDGVNGDGSSDTFGAESSFLENGADSIYGYEFSDDGDNANDDQIDLSDALVAFDPLVDDIADFVKLENGILSVDPTGLGDFDSDGDLTDDAWFTVYSDNGATPASDVVIAVDDLTFVV